MSSKRLRVGGTHWVRPTGYWGSPLEVVSSKGGQPNKRPYPESITELCDHSSGVTFSGSETPIQELHHLSVEWLSFKASQQADSAQVAHPRDVTSKFIFELEGVHAATAALGSPLLKTRLDFEDGRAWKPSFAYPTQEERH